MVALIDLDLYPDLDWEDSEAVNRERAWGVLTWMVMSSVLGVLLHSNRLNPFE